jgi:hypothetical protein
MVDPVVPDLEFGLGEFSVKGDSRRKDQPGGVQTFTLTRISWMLNPVVRMGR